MSHDDLERAGFKDRTRVAEALETVLDAVSGHDRTERVALGRADGRVLAEPVTAPTPVPGYDRAAMDGYAVRAEDTFGATGRSPAILREGEGAVAPGEAVRVHTGSDLPDGADAVVMIEEAEPVGDEVEVFDAVAEGENVGDVGEDVAEGQELYQPGHRIRPSDLGLLKSVGVDQVEVYEPPTVGVIPTGEELVQRDPGPGEVIETNGLTVSQLANRWGGVPAYRNVVDDDPNAIRAAIQRDLAKDVVVTTGGSSVGERDYTPEVVDELGEVLVHGVALKPGHPVALGVVEETPVIMLPGYPVACIINAVQFLRPVLKTAGNMPVPDQPTVEAELARKISSEPGTRTFARVRLTDTEDGYTAEPTRASGSGVLSSVALADGWVVVPEEREGYDEGEIVAVEDWEWSA
ncbi:molybdopterin molybdotransferase MoeA [Haloplanus aerogenes]|uniref:Molybdopterin molybdenumtransferase MoeA n=1 Tax=Haloplanus aerogenes TaxID=660522 RepID=A0A3M0CTX4_9EURY|nr:gephyrin-like molybdotransferase Glp [Haloplanus aerogenes]AZH26663.1 molybdopterin molybdenumtransferase MoeA [Haloplanus aerogenes]RMB12901.1 molybdopterin molybdotransferase [Haloplanus aerogenes]